MPTYEYRCSSGHDFEKLQRMSDEPIRECPICGATAERQMSTGGGFVFKGSGFYITDTRSESYKKAAAADTGTPPAASTPADGPKAPAKDAPKEAAPAKAAPKTDSGSGSSGSSSPKTD